MQPQLSRAHQRCEMTLGRDWPRHRACSICHCGPQRLGHQKPEFGAMCWEMRQQNQSLGSQPVRRLSYSDQRESLLLFQAGQDSAPARLHSCTKFLRIVGTGGAKRGETRLVVRPGSLRRNDRTSQNNERQSSHRTPPLKATHRRDRVQRRRSRSLDFPISTSRRLIIQSL